MFGIIDIVEVLVFLGVTAYLATIHPGWAVAWFVLFAPAVG